MPPNLRPDLRPNMRQLEAFLAVAEHGNFSRAAETLGMAQPGVSQAVRDLEALLGQRLFDRTTRQVVLTAAGTAFRDGAQKGLEALDMAVAGARDLGDLRRGHLRLAAPPFLAATVLPGVLAGFGAGHPGLTLDLADNSTVQIMDLLRRGKADLGLGTFPPDEAGLSRRVVLHDEMMAFAPTGFHLPTPLRWADLAGVPVIILARSSALRLPVDLGFEAAGIALKPAFEVGQIATALALASAGLGVALLPGYARAARHHGLVALDLTAPLIRREVALIHPTGRSLSPAAAEFSDYLTHSLRRLAPSG